MELGRVRELGVAAGELLHQRPELGSAGLDPHGVGDVDDLDGLALGFGSLGGLSLLHAAQHIVHGAVLGSAADWRKTKRRLSLYSHGDFPRDLEAADESLL